MSILEEGRHSKRAVVFDRPVVTDTMLVAACVVYYGPSWCFVEAEAMRVALEAAMAAR